MGLANPPVKRGRRAPLASRRGGLRRPRGGWRLIPHLELPTDHLLRRLRTLTCLRLRASRRGDDGLAVLIARERATCLEALRAAAPKEHRIAA